MVYFILTHRIPEIQFGTPPRISGIEIGTAPPGFLELKSGHPQDFWSSSTGGVRILNAMAQ
jgi:hypothetical protein